MVRCLPLLAFLTNSNQGENPLLVKNTNKGGTKTSTAIRISRKNRSMMANGKTRYTRRQNAAFGVSHHQQWMATLVGEKTPNKGNTDVLPLMVMSLPLLVFFTNSIRRNATLLKRWLFS